MPTNLGTQPPHPSPPPTTPRKGRAAAAWATLFHARDLVVGSQVRFTSLRQQGFEPALYRVAQVFDARRYKWLSTPGDAITRTSAAYVEIVPLAGPAVDQPAAAVPGTRVISAIYLQESAKWQLHRSTMVRPGI